MLIDIKASDFPSYWADCVNNSLIEELIALYHEGAVLMPTFSPRVAKNKKALESYFNQLSSREGMQVNTHEETLNCLQIEEKTFVVNGIYDFKFNVDSALLTFPSRFTFVIDLGKENPILHHHSSQIPRTLT
mgnify:CR=1 FL=1|jgi:hypothetical protein